MNVSHEELAEHRANLFSWESQAEDIVLRNVQGLVKPAGKIDPSAQTSQVARDHGLAITLLDFGSRGQNLGMPRSY